jgi:hypothetical protein
MVQSWWIALCQPRPLPWLQTVAPDRTGLVVAVACLFTWHWLAVLWAAQGMSYADHQPFGHDTAESMEAPLFIIRQSRPSAG